MKRFTSLLLPCLLSLPWSAVADKPNVLILYVDDMGYADLATMGNKEISTPHMDSLAKNGARFDNSYVSGCVCSPSRAGLMTGRYQQRFGFDANAEGGSKRLDKPKGLDLAQTTFAQHFKKLGYATGIVGKWHIGSETPEYLPNARGFDEFYGLLPHGIGAGKGGEPVPIYRNAKQVETPADHTVAFGKEAESFIGRHKDSPWMLYCAFTAVHGPHVAPESYLKRFENIASKGRRGYLAMLACLDDVIGGILGKLREHKLEEDTLIFFASDNGGPGGAASNGIFRGTKWTLWEGGVRSPIFIQWKGRIPGGRTFAQPVIQLDWLPTALAAAGESGASFQLAASDKPQAGSLRHTEFDGVNLLPLLEGKTTAAPHDTLYWRFGVQFAVRQGDWKLVKASKSMTPALFNLATDPGEKNDLAMQQPERAKQLQALWDAWNAKNEPPRWIDERWNGLEEKAANKQEKKGKGKKGKKRQTGSTP